MRSVYVLPGWALFSNTSRFGADQLAIVLSAGAEYKLNFTCEIGRCMSRAKGESCGARDTHDGLDATTYTGFMPLRKGIAMHLDCTCYLEGEFGRPQKRTAPSLRRLIREKTSSPGTRYPRCDDRSLETVLQ